MSRPFKEPCTEYVEDQQFANAKIARLVEQLTEEESRRWKLEAEVARLKDAAHQSDVRYDEMVKIHNEKDAEIESARQMTSYWRLKFTNQEKEIARLSSLLEQARDEAQELSDEFEAKGRKLLVERMESEGLLWLGYSARLLALAAHPAHKEQEGGGAVEAAGPTAGPSESSIVDVGEGEEADVHAGSSSNAVSRSDGPEGQDAVDAPSPASPVCRWRQRGA